MKDFFPIWLTHLGMLELREDHETDKLPKSGICWDLLVQMHLLRLMKCQVLLQAHSSRFLARAPLAGGGGRGAVALSILPQDPFEVTVAQTQVEGDFCV